MSFWSSWKKRARPEAGRSEPVDPAPLPKEEEPALSPDVERLLRIGDGGGAAGADEAEAIALLREIRKTADEGLALDGLVQRNATHPLPEALAIAVAAALVDRGDRPGARALLEGATGAAALVLRADMLAEDGDFAGAVATIERVLVRDLDVPGARERRVMWRSRLGLGTTERRVDPATATVATPHARTPFDLLREVARGGAGAVFAARDRELGRTVAVKVYHQIARDKAQLLHEGRVAAALEGPGVVRVFDIEPSEGWIALEWATLGALRDVLLRAGAREPDAMAALGPVRRWLPRLADALARVHAAGWVHHDVKPANVLMSVEAGDRDAVPWLADFGSARRVGEPSPPGSIGYVSPERLAGRASDTRDDVYGFGRVVEEVLAVMPDDPDAAALRGVAAICVGDSDGRPRDGADLAATLSARLHAGTLPARQP